MLPLREFDLEAGVFLLPRRAFLGGSETMRTVASIFVLQSDDDKIPTTPLQLADHFSSEDICFVVIVEEETVPACLLNYYRPFVSDDALHEPFDLPFQGRHGRTDDQ